MNLKRVLLAMNLVTVPMALFLIYRLVTTDGYEKTDYQVMFFMFSMLIVGRILKWIACQEDNSGT
ncbi:MAG: hypothetical protein AAF391_07105 [Bacteroidota bacterium]